MESPKILEQTKDINKIRSVSKKNCSSKNNSDCLKDPSFNTIDKEKENVKVGIYTTDPEQITPDHMGQKFNKNISLEDIYDNEESNAFGQIPPLEDIPNLSTHINESLREEEGHEINLNVEIPTFDLGMSPNTAKACAFIEDSIVSKL